MTKKMMATKGKGQKPPSKFISKDAEKRFELIAQRQFLKERGFAKTDIASKRLPSEISELIHQNNWRNFAEQQSIFCPGIVREVYANIFSLDSIYIRNLTLVLNAEEINNFWSIPEVEDEFFPFLDNITEEQLRDVVNEIAVEGTQWVIAKQGSRHLNYTSLLPVAKIWYLFIKTKLMPTGNNDKVTQPRAVLLFCILRGRQIDVGQIISREILECVNKPNTVLVFPCLITEMCWAMNLPNEPEEEEVNLDFLSKITINRLLREPVVAAPPVRPQPDVGSSSQPNDVFAKLLVIENAVGKLTEVCLEIKQSLMNEVKNREEMSEAFQEGQERVLDLMMQVKGIVSKPDPAAQKKKDKQPVPDKESNPATLDDIIAAVTAMSSEEEEEEVQPAPPSAKRKHPAPATKPKHKALVKNPERKSTPPTKKKSASASRYRYKPRTVKRYDGEPTLIDESDSNPDSA